MDQIVIPGVPEQRVDLDQWFTEPELAKRIVALAIGGIGYRQLTVLEPSAGQGAFVHELLRYPNVRVVSVELDPDHVDHMRQRFSEELSTGQLSLVQGDFLTAEPYPGKFDLTVMNPPFTFGAEFVAKALMVSDSVVALMKTDFINGVKNYQLVWSKAYLAGLKPLVARPKFGGNFTPSCGYSVFEIRPTEHGMELTGVSFPTTEWWR